MIGNEGECLFWDVGMMVGNAEIVIHSKYCWTNINCIGLKVTYKDLKSDDKIKLKHNFVKLYFGGLFDKNLFIILKRLLIIINYNN